MKSKDRLSNIELLRILSVFMISATHYLSNGILWNVPFGSFNTILARVFESLVVVCVNEFILISGYFGKQSKGINIRRLVDLVLMVAFFNCSGYVVGIAVGKSKFSIIGLIQSLFPYMFEGYWFIRVYLMLVLITPFINIGLKKLTVRSYTYLVIILYVIASILPSFFEPFKDNGGLNITNFMFMYILGGYIRVVSDKLPSAWKCLALYFCFAAVTSAFSVYGNNLPYFAYNFVSVVPESCFLFAFFAKINFKSRFVNYISVSSLCSFVLENSIGSVTGNIYKEVFKVANYQTSDYFIVHFACTTIIFTAFCFAVDCLRRLIFKYTVDKGLNKIEFINKRVLVNLEETDQ